MLKRQKGNMYEFVSHMWSPIKGKCSHDCSYCYMKRFPQKPLHLDEKDLQTNLGLGNFIFVCHTCDMFAEDVYAEWIAQVLDKCNSYDNRYLFQTKNPKRLYLQHWRLPEKLLIGTTIETNRDIVSSKAPTVADRAKYLGDLSKACETMVTIEPIFDFDLEPMIDLIVTANPEWVNIGADSKGHGLPEPSAEKVRQLIDRLKETKKIKLKGNLRRLIKMPSDYPQEYPD